MDKTDLLKQMLVMLDNYSADLNLASNYGEFAEAQDITLERLQQIDSLRDAIKQELEHPTSDLPDSIKWALNSGDGVYRP